MKHVWYNETKNQLVIAIVKIPKRHFFWNGKCVYKYIGEL